MDYNNTCETFFAQNTDITGIGVRIAFYLQANLLSLMIAGVATTAKGELSLYNALLINYLVWLANMLSVIFVVVAGAPSRAQRLEERLLDILFHCELLLSAALTIYLFVTAPHFGTHSECIPSLMFYFAFWRAFHIALVWRIVWIASASTVVFAALIMPFFRVGNSRSWRVIFDFYAGLLGFHTVKQSWESVLDAQSQPRKGMARSTVVLVAVFWIVMDSSFIPYIELSIKYYAPQNAENSRWGFGQIFALLTVMPSLIAVLLALGRRSGVVSEGLEQDRKDSNAIEMLE